SEQSPAAPHRAGRGLPVRTRRRPHGRARLIACPPASGGDALLHAPGRWAPESGPAPSVSSVVVARPTPPPGLLALALTPLGLQPPLLGSLGRGRGPAH